MPTTLRALAQLEVVDASGDRVGRVIDVELDPETWQVKALVIRLERHLVGRLGMKRGVSRPELALTVLHVREVGEVVQLRDDLDDLAFVAPAARAEAEQLPH